MRSLTPSMARETASRTFMFRLLPCTATAIVSERGARRSVYVLRRPEEVVHGGHRDAIFVVRRLLDRLAARDAGLEGFRVVQRTPDLGLRHGNELLPGHLHRRLLAGKTAIIVPGSQVLRVVGERREEPVHLLGRDAAVAVGVDGVE